MNDLWESKREQKRQAIAALRQALAVLEAPPPDNDYEFLCFDAARPFIQGAALLLTGGGR